jgi:hypothetical protein
MLKGYLPRVAVSLFAGVCILGVDGDSARAAKECPELSSSVWTVQGLFRGSLPKDLARGGKDERALTLVLYLGPLTVPRASPLAPLVLGPGQFYLTTVEPPLVRGTYIEPKSCKLLAMASADILRKTLSDEFSPASFTPSKSKIKLKPKSRRGIDSMKLSFKISFDVEYVNTRGRTKRGKATVSYKGEGIRLSS